MKNIFWILVVWGMMLPLSQFCIAQTMWPGDVNNNGIVNGIDVLYVGLASGAEEEERVGGNASWTEQTITSLWEQSFVDGINYAYADCDGDGEIEEEDISNAIKINFGKTHGTVLPDEYSGAGGGNAPFVELLPQVANVGLNDMIHFDLWLGSTDTPVQNFYGIAMELSYNPDFVLSGAWNYEGISSPWFDPVDDDSETLFFVDPVAGKMHLAITRTDQQSISGAGKIGDFSIVIEDIVVGFLSDTLTLQIDKIRMIDQNFSTLSVVPDSTFVVISRPDRTVNQYDTPEVSVYPNPVNDFFTIQSTAPVTGYELTDIAGKQVLKEERLDERQTITISKNKYDLHSQLYLLKVYTKKGMVVKKIIVQ